MPLSRLARSAIAALLCAACAPALAAHPLQTIDVLCGGVASEERQRLAGEVRGATIELEFFSGTKGNYVAEVDVLFSPIEAQTAAFGIVTDGPVCLVELPPGKYRVYTWFNGNARSTTATIERGQQLVRVSLGFPEERGADPFLVPVANETQRGAP